MPAPEQVLYAMPAMRALSRAEAAAVASRMPPRAGSFGLRIGMQEGMGECPDAVAHWVRLCCRDACWTGDLRARCDEPLPFADDSFALVWLSQVLQFQHDREGLLHEAFRVTAPGGLLLVSGMHPLSAWTPWLAWNLRDSGDRLRLQAPARLARALARAGYDVGSRHRFGSSLPRAARSSQHFTVLGGGYLLTARKRQDALTPLRVVRLPRAAPVHGSLAPGAHRECA